MSKDWLPRRREEQLAMAKKWLEVLPVSNGAWTVTPAEISELKDLTEEAERWQNKLDTGGHSPATTARARDEYAAMVKYMRDLHKRKFFSPPMEDHDWVRLGLKPPDTTPTPEPVPSTVPEIECNTSVIRQLSLRVRDFGSKSWGKPDHVHSIELAWDIREERPAEVGELPNLEVVTASPIVLKFEEGQRGKRVYFAARWTNNTAQPGPWSDIESAFIP